MKLKRTLIWSSIACALLGVALGGYAYFFLDEPPPADQDLRLEWEDVPETENGFHLLTRREGLGLDLPLRNEDEYEKTEPFGERWDGKVARELLDRNERILQAYAESRSHAAFQVPEAHRHLLKFSYLPAWRGVVRLLGMRVGVLFEDGKAMEAFEESLEILRFAKRMESSRGGLIPYLVGVGVRSQACSHLRQLLSRSRLPAEQLRPFFEPLLEFKGSRTDLIEAVKVDYQLLVQRLEQMSRGKAKPVQVSLKLNQTKRLLAESRRELIGRIQSLPDHCTYLKSEDLPAAQPPAWYSWRNRLGHDFLRKTAPVITVPSRQIPLGDLSVNVTSALFALMCFRNDQGRLPGSLDELVPRYLKELPRDPFDGKPLRYSPENKIIYSVGRDLTDFGGSEADEPEADDYEPTFRIMDVGGSR